VFSSPEEVAQKLRAIQYLVADELLPVVYLAMKLGKPLLVEGPPGSGKTDSHVPLRKRPARSSKGFSVMSGSMKKRRSALLLELFSEWQISMPKLGTVKAKTIPFVVLTSNEERQIGNGMQ